MGISIGSRVSTSLAIRHLNAASSDIQQSLERLSSGLRINRPFDDPAGLAVGSALALRQKVLSRALLNVNDGISALTYADSTISQLSGVLSRMAELAQQAANGAFSRTQRLALNQEYFSLDQEIRRLAASARFNGIDLLAGVRSSGRATQVGSEAAGAMGSYSGDGRYLAFGYTTGAGFEIYDNVTGAVTSVSLPGMSVGGLHQLINGDVIAVGGTLFVSNDLYYYSKAAGTLTKLTGSSDGGDAAFVAVSADGSKVVFSSKTHYADGLPLGDLNPGSGTQRIFTLDLETGIFRTVAMDVTNILGLKISANGSKVAFVSTNDLLGDGDGGVRRTFLLDLDQSTLAYTRLTGGAGSMGTTLQLGGVNNYGEVIVKSRGDPLGQNPLAVDQFFLVSLGSVRQLTSYTANLSGFGFKNQRVDGTGVQFVSSSNLTGENPSSYVQVFELDLQAGGLRQLTSVKSNGSFSGVSADGRYALFTNLTYWFSLDSFREGLSMDVEVGQGVRGGILASIASVLTVIAGLGAYTLTSRNSAAAALDGLRLNIENLAASRGGLGASLSRLYAAERLIRAEFSELGEAKSRIQDADIALETALLTSRSIRQQAAAAITAQANQQMRLVLQLLSSK